MWPKRNFGISLSIMSSRVEKLILQFLRVVQGISLVKMQLLDRVTKENDRTPRSRRRTISRNAPWPQTHDCQSGKALWFTYLVFRIAY